MTWAPLALFPVLTDSWDDALAILAAGASVSLLRPQRGLPDCIARTWLVPR